jgi:hypothetical protein
VAGFSDLRRLLMVMPAAEKARSLYTEDAMMDKKSPASEAQTG